MVRWEEEHVDGGERRTTFTPVGRGALGHATITVFLGIDRLVSMARRRQAGLESRFPRLVKHAAR